MKIKNIFSLIISSGLLIACGKGQNKTNSEIKSQEHLEIDMLGTYHALLAPLNKKVSRHLSGAVTLVKEDEEFTADVRFSGGPPSIIHAQNIHIGTRCPNEQDDLNNDDFVDAQEASKVIGDIIIPLDDDLSSQWSGLGTFPISDEYGHYAWSRTTPFQKLAADLRDIDINLSDGLVKLAPNKPVNLEGNVVVILGVPESAELPASVSGQGRMNKHAALPIACGLIKRLTKVPGQIDDDSTGIPLPDGETIGGSSGADDGAIFDPVDPSNYGEDIEEPNNSTEFDE